MSLANDKVRIVVGKYQVRQIDNIRQRRKIPFHAVDSAHRNNSCSVRT